MIKLNKLKEYFLYFMAYSVFGWCYEVFLEVVVYRWGYSDRGVLTGPYCPVYGVGALVFLLLFKRILNNRKGKESLKLIPFVFAGTAIAATAIELAASYICEYFTGAWPWQTYADYTFNYQARIALSPSVRFGIGGVMFLYVLQPVFERLYHKVGEDISNTVAFVIFTLFFVDFINLLLHISV